MVFTVLTLDRSEEWDAIVRSFKRHDVYWLSGYVKGFEIHGDGFPLLLYYEDKGIRGINVLMKRDIAEDNRFINLIPKGQYFDVSTPYGYGGWIIEGIDNKQLFSAYESWAQNNGIISDFVRFHPLVKNHAVCSGFYDIVELGEVVHMDLSSPEAIWDNITSKNRNMIRKAEKNNINVFNGRFPHIFNEFRSIYNSTMIRDEADEYYFFEEKFYDSLLYDLSQNAQVFWAEKEGTVIAAAIILVENGFMNYHLSGSRREYSSLAPTNLLLYTASLWGYANGCSSFYLGGGVGSGEDGLFKFKRAFNKGESNSFYIGKKIFDNIKYEELLNLRADSTEGSNYFPKYRA